MLVFIIRRTLTLGLILLGMSMIIFFISRGLPGDPAVVVAGGEDATAEMIEFATQQLGLDKPLIVQYIYYMRNFVLGDLGRSIISRRLIIDEIKQFLPATIEISLAAIIWSCLVGIPLGAIAAIRAGKRTDNFCRILTISLGSMPIFWIGLMLVLVFYKILGILPAGGRLNPATDPPTFITGLYIVDSLLTARLGIFIEALSHLLLPALVLGGFTLALITRTTRSAMLDVLREDYIRTARAKGLSETKVYFKHALRNVSAPIVTVAGLQLGQFMGGVVITETIFSWPGLGLYAMSAVDMLDYPVIVIWTLVFSFFYALINIVADIVCARLNPQISL